MGSIAGEGSAAPAAGRLLSRIAWPVGVAVGALLAFRPSYFGLFPRFHGTSAIVHFHAATMLAWLALGVAQPVLARRGRVELHRTLGAVAYALLPLIAVGFWLTLQEGQIRRKEPVLILATAFDGGLFLLLAGLGLLHRHRRGHHAAFMMLSLVPFLNPILGRLVAPGLGLPIELLLLVVLLVRARRRKEVAAPYAVALAAFLLGAALLAGLIAGAPELPERLWRALVA